MDIIKGGVDQSPFVDTISMSASIDSEDIDFESWYGIQETRKQQREDPDISKILTMKRKGESPKMTELTPGTRLYQLAKDFDRFMLKRGLLHRNTTTNGDCREQVVLPLTLLDYVLDSLHDQAGHQCRECTLSLVQDRFFWPGMWTDIENKIKACERCIKPRARTNNKAPLVNITSV